MIELHLPNDMTYKGHTVWVNPQDVSLLEYAAYRESTLTMRDGRTIRVAMHNFEVAALINQAITEKVKGQP